MYALLDSEPKKIKQASGDQSLAMHRYAGGDKEAARVGTSEGRNCRAVR